MAHNLAQAPCSLRITSFRLQSRQVQFRVENGITYDRDGEVVKRFGFHNLRRNSLATFLMDEQENPAVVQAIMRHAKMDMTLYYGHSSRKAKRAAQEKMLQHLIPAEMRVQVQVQKTIQ